jgi:hypothetical protein
MTQSSLLMLSWATCGDDGHWCDFLRLKLDSGSLSMGGVYVIWSEDADGSRKVAVYVGQGKPVDNCLARHRDEATITLASRPLLAARSRAQLRAPTVRGRTGCAR